MQFRDTKTVFVVLTILKIQIRSVGRMHIMLNEALCALEGVTNAYKDVEALRTPLLDGYVYSISGRCFLTRWD
jgi:hypothetical protein